MMKKYSGNHDTITCLLEENVLKIILSRPDVHNAFNDEMLAELIECFDETRDNEDIRVIILTGSGGSFCAGADLNWMKDTVDFDFKENLEDARRVSECMYKLYTLPQPTICKLNGAAIGGGVGFVAACDIAIAADSARLSLSEVKIGLVPACISPYVIKKIGESAAREFFLTGERMSAETARRIGLVNQVMPYDELNWVVKERVGQLIGSGPEAIHWCKELIRKVPAMDLEKAGEYTAEVIAGIRVGEEGQEGIKAFLEKRKPRWVENKDD